MERQDVRGEETWILEPSELLETARRLRDHDGFNVLRDLTVVDRLKLEPSRPRFEVVYHLACVPALRRLRLKVRVEERDATVPSVTGLWRSADWFEREAWDMFGVRFTGHPNLKRLLMYDGFQGHPLRKDYPVNKRQPLVGPVN